MRRRRSRMPHHAMPHMAHCGMAQHGTARYSTTWYITHTCMHSCMQALMYGCVRTVPAVPHRAAQHRTASHTDMSVRDWQAMMSFEELPQFTCFDELVVLVDSPLSPHGTPPAHTRTHARVDGRTDRYMHARTHARAAHAHTCLRARLAGSMPEEESYDLFARTTAAFAAVVWAQTHASMCMSWRNRLGMHTHTHTHTHTHSHNAT